MVMKKIVFSALLAVGLFGAFQAKAMEALGDAREALRKELTKRLANLDQETGQGQPGLTRARRSHSDSDLLVPFPPAHSTDDYFNNWGEGCTAANGSMDEDPALILPEALPSQADPTPSIGRRAGRAIGAYLKKITEKPLLTRARRSDSDPTLLSPLETLKHELQNCQQAVEAKKNELLAAEEELKYRFELEVNGSVGDDMLRQERCKARAQCNRLRVELEGLQDRFQEIANKKTLLNIALLNAGLNPNGRLI